MLKGIEITDPYVIPTTQENLPHENYPPPPSYTVATCGDGEPSIITTSTPSTIQFAPPQAFNGTVIIESRGIKGWFERYQKNKPQNNSVAAGFFLLLVSGLHIGWGIYRLIIRGHWVRPWNITNVQLTFIITVFYIGSNIGAGIGHYLLMSMKKKYIYYICGALNIISSIAFMAGYDEIGAIFVGRIFAGLAYGICYMTVIVHASENCIKEMRGLILSSINYCIITSIFILTIFSILPMGNDIYTSVDFWIGIIALIYSILAILCVPFLTYESVIFLLNKNEDNKALMNMMKLRNESVETWDIRSDYEEMKIMINEDKNDSTNLFRNNQGIFLLMLTQLLSTLSTSFALNIIMLFYVESIFGCNYGILFLAPRLITALIPIFLSDFIGRRYLLFIANILAAFIGLGTNAISDVLLSEAFSTTKKNGSIRSLFIFEQIIHIILIVITMNINVIQYITFFITIPILFGVLMILITIILYYYLPETKKKSLRDTRHLFKRCRRIN